VRAGSELLGQGDLPQAILALEAAVRSEPACEASDSTQLDEAGREEARRESVAWQLLGQAHADADDDATAISCLRRAVAADAQNLAALLALGVSYTNELDASRALDHLRLWLRRHPDFASLAPAEEEVGKGKYDVWARQADTTALFLRAVGRAPNSADLHAVLGVLHNLSREYGAAVGPRREGCFREEEGRPCGSPAAVSRSLPYSGRSSYGRRTTPFGTNWARRRRTR